MADHECKVLAFKRRQGTHMLIRWYPFVATGIQMLKNGSVPARDALHAVLNIRLEWFRIPL